MTLVEAVSLNGTYIQTTGSNLTVNITPNNLIYADILTVNSMNISFDNLTRILGASDKITFMLFEQQKNYTGLDLPYILAESGTKKTIPSGFAEVINASVVFNTVACEKIQHIYYKSASGLYQKDYVNHWYSVITGYDYTCSGRTVYLNIKSLENGNNIITIEDSKNYGDACALFNNSLLSSIAVFGILILVIFIATIIIIFRGGEADPKLIIGGGIIILILAIILFFIAVIINGLC